LPILDGAQARGGFRSCAFGHGRLLNDRQKSHQEDGQKLSLNVRRALSKTKGMVVKNIFVRARSGAITLSGSVPDVALISKAAEAAAGVPGVTSVTNRLSVQDQNYY
jgi:hyperosmotically inducible periplasmic protein